jgi:hypothetical protein
MEVGCKSGRPSLLEIQVSSVFLILVRTLEMPPYHLINVHFVDVSQTDLHFTSTSKVITFILVIHFNSGGLAKRTLNASLAFLGVMVYELRSILKVLN